MKLSVLVFSHIHLLTGSFCVPAYASCGDMSEQDKQVSCLMEPTVTQGEAGIASPADPESITDFINAMKARKERKWGQ